MMLRRSDRLIGGTVLASLAMVWLVLLGFDLITAYAEEMDEIGEGNYTALNAMFYTLYTMPRRAYVLFPTAAVIGCVLGLGALAATSELTALRAAGLSRLRISLAALLVIGALTAVMVLVAETLGPAGEKRAQALAVSAKSKDGPDCGRAKATPSSTRSTAGYAARARSRGSSSTACACTSSAPTAVWHRSRSRSVPSTATASGRCSSCAARASSSAA
jgi:lipopolysaccharide export LptBFGC system permease protein LptF